MSAPNTDRVDAAGSRLRRTITFWPLVLFGLAYIGPFIVLTTFGVFSEASDGALAMSYLLASAAMIFTAISYARLAALYPVAGSAYSYARRTVGPRTGFMVGWAILLDYFFLPMVVWLIGVSYLNSQFPAVPKVVWVLGFILITTTLNKRFTSGESTTLPTPAAAKITAVPARSPTAFGASARPSMPHATTTMARTAVRSGPMRRTSARDRVGWRNRSPRWLSDRGNCRVRSRRRALVRRLP